MRPARLSQTSPRVARLIGEVWWILLLTVVLYGALIFTTYNRADPGWSFSGTGEAVRNKGGVVGAWIADLCFYLLGSAAWWMIVAGILALMVAFWRLRAQNVIPEYSFGLALFGFMLLIVSSAALEATHPWLVLMANLRAPGGVIGEIAGFQLQALLGATGARFLLVALWAIGLSLFTGISWMAVAEKLGWALERSFNALRKTIEARQDRKIGRQVMAEREQVVEQVRGEGEMREPVLVVPSVTVIPQSLRIEKEKQRQLFDELPATSLPPLSLLDAAVHKTEAVSAETLEFTSRLIERKLADFGISAKVLAAYPGPIITRYEIEPAIGVKGSQIVTLVKDLARALSVVSIRVVETIPGKSCMALELPNPKRQIVRLIEILSSKSYHEATSRLTLGLGKDIAGNPVVADLAKMPHVLVAGTTGSGKSVALNAMILSLLYKTEPRQVRLLLIDPKMLELSIYEGIPHLLTPVVTDMRLAPTALNWCVGEMERRYKLMSHLTVRNIAGYNAKVSEAKRNGAPLTNPLIDQSALTPDNPEPLEEMPQIVVVVDELADLMMVTGKKIEELIARIAQKARAAGIHLILATQRPSVDVITGLIKANIPTRIAFQVASKVDSRTILDQMGAEALLGQGDMLYLPPGSGFPQRVHGAFVSDEEVHHVVDYLKRQGPPNYLENILTEQESDDENGNG
ncbi:MAG: DNA translocase FtsK 4TM domain-containing protein, partial [Burkholderiales bacterium]|nr:DNA translocase FtsK 4TM domain-containing protein [Burkholderiales bacterium]